MHCSRATTGSPAFRLTFRFTAVREVACWLAARITDGRTSAPRVPVHKRTCRGHGATVLFQVLVARSVPGCLAAWLRRTLGATAGRSRLFNNLILFLAVVLAVLPGTAKVTVQASLQLAAMLTIKLLLLGCLVSCGAAAAAQSAEGKAEWTSRRFMQWGSARPPPPPPPPPPPQPPPGAVSSSSTATLAANTAHT